MTAAIWSTRFSREIDPTEVASFEASLLQEPRTPSRADRVPLVYPLAWLGASSAGEALALLVDHDREILFHELQELSYERQLHYASAYDIEITVAEIDAPGRRIEIVLSASDAAGLRVLRMRTLLRVLDIESLAGASREKSKNSARPSADFVLDEIHPLDEARVSLYLVASGDDNPIHRQGPAIRRLGLIRPIVPGLLVFSLIGGAAARSAANGEVRSLSCRFLLPLTVPATIAIRRRVVRSKPAADGVETIARLYAGTEDCPMACMAEVIAFERASSPGSN